MSIVIGIDASRCRSGGAIAHLIGIISEGNPTSFGIREVHIWSYNKLLEALPEKPWLEKHNPPELGQSLIKQIWWQATKLENEAATIGCNILFSCDAATLCRFKPMVVLSQDMLSYEPGAMKRFGFTKARLRLLAILYLQNRTFQFANGVIFLTEYSAKVIQQSCGPLPRISFIPHGIGTNFKHTAQRQIWPEKGKRPIRCLYTSPTWWFKHQWVVVQAIATLRERGYNITLTLVGGGTGKAQELLDKQIAINDPDNVYITQKNFVPQSELPTLLADADIFVFASSCENMPVTLLEAMAVGLPIACSDRGPMPEVLADGGVYFNPEDNESIAKAIEQLITLPLLRQNVAKRAKQLSENYSWARCSNETFNFISQTVSLLRKEA